MKESNTPGDIGVFLVRKSERPKDRKNNCFDGNLYIIDLNSHCNLLICVSLHCFPSPGLSDFRTIPYL